MDSGDFAGALPYLAQAMELDSGNKATLVQHQIRVGSLINQCPKITQMWFDPKPIYDVSLSRDGRRALRIEGWGRAQIFDTSTGQPITPEFGQDSGLTRGTFNSDGSLVVTASEDNTACVWKSSDGSKVRCLVHPLRPLSACFSPDDTLIVTGCTDNLAWVWEVASSKPRFKLAGHTKAVLFATFSHSGKLIATCSRDFTVRIWDATTGTQLGEPLPHPNWVDFVAFSPNDQTVATACQDHKARVWNVNTHERILPDFNHDEIVSSIGFSPDGRFIITGSFDGTARLWLSADHQPSMQAPVLRHSDRVKHVSFGGDGHRIITGCIDGTVRIWDLAAIEVAEELKLDRLCWDKTRFLTISNQTVQVWETVSRRAVSPPIAPTGQVIDATLSADGRFALSISRPPEGPKELANLLEAWDVRTGRRRGPALHCTNALSNLRLSPDATRLLMFGGSSAQTFDLTGGRWLASWQLRDALIKSALFSPAGDTVAIWTEQVLVIFDSATGRPRFEPLSHPFTIRDVEFSRDGLELVTCGADETLGPCYAQIWSATDGKPIGAQLLHGDGVICSTISPDNHFALTGGEDSKAIVWQLPSGSPSAVIKHKDKVMGVAFSPDQKSFLTASLDRTARVWTSDTGNPLSPPQRHHSGVKSAKFLPDGVHLITSDMQNRVWIWLLRREQRPIKDVIRFSRLLSGEAIIPISAGDSRRGERLEDTWNQLRTRYPSGLEVSKGEIANWYNFQADESELEANVPAEVFYLGQLQEMRPGDSFVTERLGRAKSRMNLPIGKIPVGGKD
jgi:WD40 repeat protein